MLNDSAYKSKNEIKMDKELQELFEESFLKKYGILEKKQHSF